MLGCAGRDPIGPAAVKEPKMWLWLMIDSQKIGWFSTRFGAELVPICVLDWYLILMTCFWAILPWRFCIEAEIWKAVNPYASMLPFDVLKRLRKSAKVRESLSSGWRISRLNFVVFYSHFLAWLDGICILADPSTCKRLSIIKFKWITISFLLAPLVLPVFISDVPIAIVVPLLFLPLFSIVFPVDAAVLVVFLILFRLLFLMLFWFFPIVACWYSSSS